VNPHTDSFPENFKADKNCLWHFVEIEKKRLISFLSQNYNTKQQVVSGGRAYDFNFPTERSDLQNWIDRSKPHQDQLRKIRESSRKSRPKRSSRKSRHNDRYAVSSIPTRRKRGSERIRCQFHQHFTYKFFGRTSFRQLFF